MLDTQGRMLWNGEPTEPAKADAYDFLVPILIPFMTQFFFFFWCQWKKDNSFIDVMWSLTFIFPIIGLIIKRFLDDGPSPDVRSWIVLSLVSIWALRLAIHIGVRHSGEDFRYV